MVNQGLLSATSKSSKPVHLSFRIPYYTNWGQSVLVCGSTPVLGSGNVKKGLLLKPVHQDDELIWCGSITVPLGFSCEYSYYVVDDGKNVLKWEMGKKRKLVLPETIKGGEFAQLRDLWQMAKYFTAYRIDHIQGFFRIWELPDHAMTGLVGKFRPSTPLSQEKNWDFWPVIASNFLSEYQKDRYEVCAPSCHDCFTLRAWWEEDEERRQRFFKNVVGSDELPPSQCVPEITYFILRQHVEASSMWAIFPLQDVFALKEEYTTRPATEETINDPTNPKHYWRYRIHMTLESFMKDKDLKATIKDLVHGSGRSVPVAGQETQGGDQVTAAVSNGTAKHKAAQRMKEHELSGAKVCVHHDR